VDLTYSAPWDCPGVDGYLSHVRSRATRLNLQPEPGVNPTTDSVDVSVEPEPDAAGWRGRITITGERALGREVRGARCEDVVEALALITVLRLEGADPNAVVVAPGVSSTGPGASGSASGEPSNDTVSNGTASNDTEAGQPPAPSTEAAPAPNVAVIPSPVPAPGASAGPEGTASGEPEPAAPEPAPPQQPVEPGASNREVVPEPELPEPLAPEPSLAVPSSQSGDTDADEDAAADEDDGARAPEPPSDPWQWPVFEGGVAAYAGYASVPGHAFRASIEAELRFGEGVSSWATLLSLAYARGNSPVPSGELTLTLLTAQLGLCPPAFIVEPSVWLRACASVRGGGLRSTVDSSDPTFIAEFDQNWRPWLAVGPSLQAGVPLGEHLVLRGLIELAVQLVRDRYTAERLDEERGTREPFVVYQPEALSIELGLGLGYAF
jgi:hypothetical protein